MNKRQLADMKKAAGEDPAKLLEYYSELAEYWDNMVGSSLTYSDDYCTRQWENACKNMDKYHNILRRSAK